MRLLIIALLCLVSGLAHAGGSISWEEVAARISKTDPEIVNVIGKTFIPDRVGIAVRIGLSVDPEHAGERVSPYDFQSTAKADSKRYTLHIEESPDYEYSGRYFFSVTADGKK